MDRIAYLAAALVAALCVPSSGAAVERVTDLRDAVDPKSHPRKPAAILERIEAIAGHHLRRWTESAGLDYPPDNVEMRAYKEERELEIWARKDAESKLVRIATLSVCALDDEPGTKLRQGDGKTPEGSYRARALYPSRHYWMWMKLNPEDIDAPGRPNDGSAFRLCLNYPTKADRARTSSRGFRNPGGGICLHGNCVSDGCLSFTNRDFLAVFAFAMHHDQTRYGPPVVAIFPRRPARPMDTVDAQ